MKKVIIEEGTDAKIRRKLLHFEKALNLKEELMSQDSKYNRHELLTQYYFLMNKEVLVKRIITSEDFYMSIVKFLIERGEVSEQEKYEISKILNDKEFSKFLVCVSYTGRIISGIDKLNDAAKYQFMTYLTMYSELDIIDLEI